jgi:uracil-DNA glycosylase
MPRAKKIVQPFIIPGEDISTLPAISHDEKISRLRALEEQTLADLSHYFNDIATRLVFGEGDPNAILMFVGEGPGAEEDRTGRPFVGRSGQLLDKMINAIGLQRSQVFIANVVKLRAADPDETGRLKDRPPNPEEVARGLPYLHKQIEIIRPRVIVTLGGPAIKHLTGETTGVMTIRGNWYSFRGIPVLPTYHPAFVLRNYTEENRRKVWSDLQAALKKAQEP